MRTPSSSNLVGESSPNLTTSNLKCRNRRCSKQPFYLEESPLDTMADQRTMAELLRAPMEGYAEAIMVPPILAKHFNLKHSLIIMMTSNQFFRLEKDNPHDNILVPLSELEKIKKINEVNIKTIQAQINNVKNELRNKMETSIQASMSNQTNELKNMIAIFFQMNTASTLGSGPLPINIIANPKGKLKAITTRSGLVIDGPSVSLPPPFINPKEDEREEETLTDPELTEDPGHPHIPYPLRMNQEKHFSELNCKAPADVASINLMPLSVWKKLGLHELISTRMTLELANRAICTPAGIARDVFVSVGKFTFLTDFVIVDYESDPRVPLILGRPFLRTARAFIDVHGEEMILHDGDERITLNMRHDTSSYLNQPHKESINMINIYNDSYEYYLEDLEIEYLHNHDPTKEMDSVLKDSVDECNLLDPNNDLIDTIPEMFTDEHTLDYSSPPLYYDVDDDPGELESDNDDVYDDPFDSKEDKIKESKLLIDELDPP
nr:hypothetical protein [Tanacetum cinerariifolium]